MRSRQTDAPLTLLVSHLSDQAALSGVLNELYELDLSLLTVESLPIAAYI